MANVSKKRRPVPVIVAKDRLSRGMHICAFGRNAKTRATSSASCVSSHIAPGTSQSLTTAYVYNAMRSLAPIERAAETVEEKEMRRNLRRMKLYVKEHAD